MRISMRHLLLFLMFLLLARVGFGQATKLRRATVKYVSVDGIYIDAGKQQGLVIGSKLFVVRSGKRIATLKVQHLSTRSAACVIIRGSRNIKKGDRVVFAAQGATGVKNRNNLNQRKPATRKRKTRKRPVNALSGFLAVQSYFQQDMSGGQLSIVEPGIEGKLVVKNLAGSGLALRIRHRSRFYHRSRAISSITPNNEWTHRLYELALVYDLDGMPVEFGFGRVLSPHIRGLGYIDGAHFAMRMNPHMLLGFAAGSEPNDATSSLHFSRKKLGMFLTYERHSQNGQRLASTLALSASYEQNHVNREFVYLQNTYSFLQWFSLYQSVEVDINRGWRKQAQGHAFSFSNLYIIANAMPASFLSLNFSYDARRNVRTFDSFGIPDSLFDFSLHQGVSGGFSLTLPHDMSLRANASLRFQQGPTNDNFYGSIYYGIRNFPRRGHALAARLAFFNTPFSRGVRPVLSYRFPFKRRVNVSLSGGGYIYRTGTRQISNYYGEISSYASIARRYYASFHLRQYFDSQLQSMQLFLESGMNF